MGRWLMALAAVAWASAAHAQGAPFDFRGVQLGITIEAFRGAPRPDGVGRAGEEVVVDCRAGAPEDMYAVCQWAVPGRPLTARSAYDLYQQSLAEALADGRTYPPTPAEFTLGLDGGTASFTFTRDEDGALKLSEILLGGDSRSFPIVEAGLIERFGRPQSRNRGTAVTGLGVVTPQDTLIWRNASSTIIARSPAGSLDTMMVVYEHTRLRALAQSRETPGNRM